MVNISEWTATQTRVLFINSIPLYQLSYPSQLTLTSLMQIIQVYYTCTCKLSNSPNYYLNNDGVNESQCCNKSQDSNKYVGISLKLEVHRFRVQDRSDKITLSRSEPCKGVNIIAI